MAVAADTHSVGATRRWPLLLLAALTAACLVAAFILAPLPQPLSYHRFADDRTFLAIPNALNVLSNLPFLWFGAQGLWVLSRGNLRWHHPREALPYRVFFLGAALTCFGSMYYHWSPDNTRLVWDRLPMTLAFSGLVAALLAERVHPSWGRRSLAPLLILGAASVLYWSFTERAGQGNVLPYGIFQGWSIAIALLVLLLFGAYRYTHGALLWWPIFWYAAAKLAEALDRTLYRATGEWVSGHTLKHLLAAVAVYALLRMLMRRELVVVTHESSAAAAAR
ncbi:MAG: alkaline phytoceramidase [Gammaproteobacteria bacterium]|nr:alkaline phytoceramidase [Gammaproteobacteria bacterium]